MSSSKKSTLQRDFAADVYLSEAQNPISPPLYVYSVYSHSEGGMEGESRTRENVGGAKVHKIYQYD
jgi:hypothetical protein